MTYYSFHDQYHPFLACSFACPWWGATLCRHLDKVHKLFKCKISKCRLINSMSGNVWAVNSYHRAVIIATEAWDGTENMWNHYENESTIRSSFWIILVNLFYIFVQVLLVNIHRKLNALRKCTVIDLRVSATSISIQAIRSFNKYLHEHHFCICHIMWLNNHFINNKNSLFH